MRLLALASYVVLSSNMAFAARLTANKDAFDLPALKQQALEMFDHAWSSYVNHAFPQDELRSLSCDGLSADQNGLPSYQNDVLGGYSVSLVDTLDMFPILGDQERFEKYVNLTIQHVSFNKSSIVQVFETTIRGMGGLLSAHLYASVPRLGHKISYYNGELLGLAYDLGLRLLPAFSTYTGIPMARVALSGETPFITSENCASGAGSLLLEFTLLSRLTGDDRFEHVAKNAFFQIWARRSDVNLIGMTLDIDDGWWMAPHTGNGASIDSYYEYALKHYILFDDASFYSVFKKLYDALNNFSFDGWWYRVVHFRTGGVLTDWVDSLAAFFPSIMVLKGDLENAVRNHLAYFKLWNKYRAIPERWSYVHDRIVLEWYPLRPEFMESNYYLFQATKDPFFMHVAKEVLQDIETKFRVACGYAGYQDIRKHSLQDRMESFFLSETIKYLYLTFDLNHSLNNDHSNFIFSTEAHPLWYDGDVLKHASAKQFPLLEEAIKNSENKDGELIREGMTANADSRLMLPMKRKGERGFLGWVKSLLGPEKYSSGLDPALSDSTDESATAAIKPIKQYTTSDQCQAWTSLDSGYSKIASWNLFYSLDSFHSLNGGKSSIDQSASFRDSYVDPDAVCREETNPKVMELKISKPVREEESKIIYFTTGELAGQTFYGLTLSLLREGGDFDLDDTISWKVTAVNGNPVKKSFLVANPKLKSNELITVLGSTVFLNSRPITNLFVVPELEGYI